MNYNKKTQTHSSLPMEKLYTHKIKTKDDDVLWEEDNEDDVAPKTPEETLPMENAQLNLDL